MPLVVVAIGVMLLPYNTFLTERAKVRRGARKSLSELIATFRHEELYYRDMAHQEGRYREEHLSPKRLEEFALGVLRGALDLSRRKRHRLRKSLVRLVGAVTVDMVEARIYVRDDLVTKRTDNVRFDTATKQHVIGQRAEDALLAMVGYLGAFRADKKYSDLYSRPALKELDKMLVMADPNRWL